MIEFSLEHDLEWETEDGLTWTIKPPEKSAHDRMREANGKFGGRLSADSEEADGPKLAPRVPRPAWMDAMDDAADAQDARYAERMKENE